MKRMRRVVALLLFLSLSTVASAGMQTLSNLFVFGDSLSDGGNSGLLTQAAAGVVYPPPPYNNGQYANGPVAVEQLWKLYNPGDNSFKPSLAGGTNYAIGGATTGLESYNAVNPNTGALAPVFAQKSNTWQLATFAAQNRVFDPASSLFVVWLFPNDAFYYATTGQLPGTVAGGAGGPGSVSQLIGNGINNIIGTVLALAASGAQHFLVPNMPDLGATPAFLGDVALSALSSAFNDNLRLALTALDAALPSAEIVQFDTAAAFRDILDNSAAYGLTNTRTACVADPACNPDTWLFWDGVHPTTATDRILAAKFRAAIPEPTTTALFAGGLLLILALRWRALTVKSRAVVVRRANGNRPPT